MASEEKSGVDKLKDKLYSRTDYQDPDGKRAPLEESDDIEAQEDWDSPELDEMMKKDRRKPEPYPVMKKFFLFALVFFVGAIVVTAAIFLGGLNFVSSKNVDITAVGPTSIRAGEVLEIGITVSNKNNANLQIANLSIQYPQGSKNPESPEQGMAYVREELGVIKAGDEINRTARVLLFGEEGEVKSIKISVEYKISGSNATFYKDKVYEVAVGDSPLGLIIDQPDSVNSGDVFTTAIVLTSLSEEILRDVVVRAEYPHGYSLDTSDPPSVGDGNLWSLGDIAPGSKTTLTLQGRLIGEDTEERTFRYYVGVGSLGINGLVLNTNLLSSQSTVSIDRPSLGLSVDLNGSKSSQYLTPAGGEVRMNLKYQNNLSDRIVSPVLTVKLSGSSLNKDSVNVSGGGNYNPSTNSITWNLLSSQGAEELEPGAGGQVYFTFNSVPVGGSQIIKIDSTLEGVSISRGGYRVSSSVSRSVKVSSQASLNSEMLHSTGYFKNTGPIPPKVGEETTYTVSLSAGNTMADIENAKIMTTLESGVTFSASSEGANISYDEATRKVTWNIGTLPSGSGYTSPSAEASFMITFIPTESQLGSVPYLVSGINLSGKEVLTGSSVNITNNPLTTRLTSDPNFVQGDELVVR